ncbi:PepSY domain-containing protein [Marinobacter fuscus]|uniref:PepSY domain-containing protein n=1 Tax=Marinobacter fuscus TaxID=2109942 RepID=A0A2T1K3M4_9GAMM|nr:PepSY domain-containing protein [Marinobacter fuscus]PSF04697.1 PepSY domain-containing protein [Marinobacter fuscus]
MKTKPVMISLVVLCLSAPVLADDDCDEPMAEWQPREHLRQKLESEGWTVYRIKVDDGCYEVKGVAPDGFRAEAEFSPATFELMELEREDDDDDEDKDRRRDRESSKARKNSQADRPLPGNGIVSGRPSVTVE